MDLLAKYEALARNYLKMVFERYYTSRKTADDILVHATITRAANELTSRQFDILEQYYVFQNPIEKIAKEYNTTLYEARKELQCGVMKLLERLNPRQYADLTHMRGLAKVVRSLPEYGSTNSLKSPKQ